MGPHKKTLLATAILRKRTKLEMSLWEVSGSQGSPPSPQPPTISGAICGFQSMPSFLECAHVSCVWVLRRTTYSTVQLRRFWAGRASGLPSPPPSLHNENRRPRLGLFPQCRPPGFEMKSPGPAQARPVQPLTSHPGSCGPPPSQLGWAASWQQHGLLGANQGQAVQSLRGFCRRASPLSSGCSRGPAARA